MAETSETAARGTSRDDLPTTVTVGSVVRPHGLRGELSVRIESEVSGRFDPGSELLAVVPGKPTRRVKVASRRDFRGGALLTFVGIADRDAAESLRGASFEVERERVPPAEPGVYYQFELIGCRCTEGEKDLGMVVDVVEDGGGLLLIVEDGDRRLPIPFVQSFLREVDVDRGRIDLELPAGLVETCASRS